LVVGQVLRLYDDKSVRIEKRQTQPPPRYSEDSLIKELVNKNIGRPATYAELLSKITARNYVEKKGNVFHPTDLGKKVIDTLAMYFTFMNYDYTANMEQQLDEIENGKVAYLRMLQDFFRSFKEEVCKAYQSHGGSLCIKCGFPMVTRVAKETGRKFMLCLAYPQCRYTSEVFS